MYTVYMHTTPSGKRYVGITCQNPKKRWENGNGYKGNEHFYRAIELYGWSNIRHEIVADGLTKAQACAMEIRLIAEYDTTSQDKGYNHSIGGESGHTGMRHSVETRRKLSEAHKGKTPPNKGKHMSAEARRKDSEAHKGANNPWYGKRHSVETRRKISEANNKSVVCVETGKQYASITEAAKAIGLRSSEHISSVCLGHRNTTGGYHWRYADDRM